MTDGPVTNLWGVVGPLLMESWLLGDVEGGIPTSHAAVEGLPAIHPKPCHYLNKV